MLDSLGFWQIQLLSGFLMFVIMCSPAPRLVEKENETKHERQPKRGNRVVSTVNGVAISEADILETMKQLDLSVNQALSKLEAEKLLMIEAERRGYGDRPEVQYVAKQAAVQKLLASAIEPVEISQDDLKAMYERNIKRYITPEYRRSLHILAKMEQKSDKQAWEAGRKFALEAIGEFSASDSVDAVFESFKKRDSELFKVVAERLPPVPKEGRFVSEFEEALFGAEQIGVIPEPVKTIYGWHAIVLLEIIAPKNISLEQAAGQLRKMIQQKKRKDRLEHLLKILREQTEIVLNEPEVKKLMSSKLVILD